jgi:hypothetical protein
MKQFIPEESGIEAVGAFAVLSVHNESPRAPGHASSDRLNL